MKVDPVKSVWLNWLLRKYGWYKTFGTAKDLDDMDCHEADGILMIAGRINEQEAETHIMNNNMQKQNMKRR